jgi:small subunit ribosomal protein S17
MAEQEDTTTENADAPEATEAAAPETEATEAAAPETEASESAVGDDTPRAAADAAAQAPAEPEPVLPPKERRQRARAAKAARAGARPSRTPEERQADRVTERRQKAKARREGRAKTRAAAKATPSSEATPPREHVAGTQKVRQGVVVSDKADKTITVRIDVARRHRRYEKIVRTSQTLHAHDEANDAHAGDTVIVRESRPLSRLKRWRLVQVVERAK